MTVIVGLNMKYVLVAFAATSLSSAAPLQLDINQIQQQLQQMFPQLQFPTSGGFQAEISLPPFLQSNMTVEEDELFFFNFNSSHPVHIYITTNK